jgi:tetratricopeptide (TPR) repeat protein
MASNADTLALAHQQFQAGNSNEAVRYYSAVLRADPSHAEALSGLGRIASQRGQHAQAIAFLRQAVTLQISSPLMTYYLGVAYRAAGHRDLAEDTFRQALRLKPDFAPAYFDLGNLLTERGAFEESMANYTLAVLIEPKFVDAHARLSLALRHEGKHDEAAEHLILAVRARPDRHDVHGLLGVVLRELGRFDEAVIHLQHAVRLKPDDARHHFHLGWTLQELGRWEESLTPLREALRLQPALAEGHHLLGRSFLRLDQLSEARKSLQQASRLKSTIPGLGRDLAQAIDRQRPIEPAAGEFQIAPIPGARLPGARVRGPSPPSPPVTLFPEAALTEALGHTNPARAQYELGLRLQANNQLHDAIGRYGEAVRLDPDFVEAYVAMGAALMADQNHHKAITALYHALRVRPDCVAALLQLTRAFRELGDRDRSVAHVRHALRLEPDNFDGHHLLGLFLALQGETEQAAAAQREALRLKPDMVNAAIQLGHLLVQMGQAQEGQQMLEQALARLPADAESLVACGELLVRLGRMKEARDCFLQALNVKPDSSWAYYSLARLPNHQFTDADLSRIRTLLKRTDLSLRDRIDLHFSLAHVLDRTKEFDEAFTHCDVANACTRQLLERQGNPFRAEAFVQLIDRLITNFDRAYFERVRSFGSHCDVPVFIIGMPRSGTSLVEQILASHPAVFGAGEIGNMKRLTEELPAALANARLYPECVASLDLAASRRLAEGYLADIKRLGAGRQRVADKTVTNFLHLGFIATLFPRAQVIHCQRDPCDVGWSCYFQNFRDVPFACDLRAIGTYYRQYQRLMAHWKAVLPIPIHDVCYEELVENTEMISRQMIAFCGLPWDDACFRFHTTERLVSTSSDIQVRQPIYKRAVGKWKNYSAHLGPLIEVLGECPTEAYTVT